MQKVLVTGGAGFIGTHLVRRLVHDGFQVTVLDNFSPQIHGNNSRLANDLKDHVNVIIGDVRDQDIVNESLRDQDVVVHFAAETGTGQSMYEPIQYESVNIGGTVNIYQYILNNPKSNISKVIVASSRSIYGEGKYLCPTHGVVYPDSRSIDYLKFGLFDPNCPHCTSVCSPLATDEGSMIHPSSLYGITKQVQEQLVLMYGKSLSIPSYALRYQNVYGPGQSLNNPYTGILAIFSNLAKNGKNINVFEDGLESRDFVFVDDVVEATVRCVLDKSSIADVFNVGSGLATTVLDITHEINRFFGNKSNVTISGDFRIGDIRHNFADLTKISKSLGFKPEWRFSEGLNTFLSSCIQSENEIEYKYTHSLDEMFKKGMYFKSKA